MTLSIEQFAIIEQVTIDFEAGMTVLSGETGAGKSIIIDALGLLCGGRGSVDYIRQGANKLMIEGLFSFDHWPLHLMNALETHGFEIDADHPDLILRREITRAGKNIIRINGQLANVATLKTIGNYLVDIHGQNEHQQLLNVQQHLPLLDAYGHLRQSTLWADYQEAYHAYHKLRQQWMDAQTNESEQLQRLDFLEYQLNELEAANLTPGEFEELEAVSQRLQNSYQIQQVIESSTYLLNDSETSILTQLAQVIEHLRTIDRYDDQIPNLITQLNSLQIDLQEISHELVLTSDPTETDQQSIDEVESRLNELGILQRKYQRSIDELIEFQDEISEEIYQIKHREHYLEELSKELKTAYENTKALAELLSQERQQLAAQLTGRVEAELADLYMAGSRFAIVFSEQQPLDEAIATVVDEPALLTETGSDRIEFYIQTNVGEPLAPLVKVASGGELSRFILAVKTVFSQIEGVKTMVFDEIDTGVSGRVGQAIAQKIHTIATHHQVLCITHLPAVAAIADEQLLIEKMTQDQKTYSQVIRLNNEQRVEAIAQMMAGELSTHHSRKVAQDLLNQVVTD